MEIEVSSKLIEKVSRLFNATIAEVLNELLQNSRRSKATCVHITTAGNGQSWATLSDNGSGIFRDGVKFILGDSGWNGEVRHEDPAGMGVFALASRGAVIESAGCQVQLNESHFCGKEDVVVESSEVFVGTKISFPVYKDEVRSIATAVEQCALYYPLPVWLNGKEFKRKSFLEGVLYREVWRGLEIGVSVDKESYVNFKGIVIELQLAKIWQKQRPPYFGYLQEFLSVRVNVASAPDLKLVLPARKEVVQNEFFKELQKECYRVIFRYVGTRASHMLPYKEWNTAKSLGVTLPEAVRYLALYKPETADFDRWSEGSDDLEEESVGENALLFTAECTSPEAQVLWRGFVASKLNYTVFEAERDYKGYKWYDALSIISNISIEVEVGGKIVSLGEAQELMKSLNKKRVNAIWVEMTITHRNSKSETVRFQTDVSFDCEGYWGDPSAVDVFVSEDSKIEVSELAELLKDCYFETSEDGDADSPETQRADFAESAREKAASILLSSEEALKERIRLVAERTLRWLVPHDRKLELSIDRKGSMTISLESSDSQLDAAQPPNC